MLNTAIMKTMEHLPAVVSKILNLNFYKKKNGTIQLKASNTGTPEYIIRDTLDMTNREPVSQHQSVLISRDNEVTISITFSCLMFTFVMDGSNNLILHNVYTTRFGMDAESMQYHKLPINKIPDTFNAEILGCAPVWLERYYHACVSPTKFSTVSEKHTFGYHTFCHQVIQIIHELDLYCSVGAITWMFDAGWLICDNYELYIGPSMHTTVGKYSCDTAPFKMDYGHYRYYMDLKLPKYPHNPIKISTLK